MERDELEKLLNTKAPVFSRQRSQLWLGRIDLPTLIIVLLGATHLGLLALGVDLVAYLGSEARKPIYAIIGLSALWQWARQR
ncbi:MAG: DUF378 domain-containing protein [Alphaproteobacteria bacterium]|nr:DUF378 domain-containing protein [Alphaproteobacteria bacterium]